MSASGFTWVNMGFKIPRLFVSRKQKARAAKFSGQKDKPKEGQTAPGFGPFGAFEQF